MYCLRPTTKKRVWYLCNVLDDGTVDEENPVREMNLLASSLTNKFEVVADFLDEVNEIFDDFGDWFTDLFDSYIKSNLNSEILFNKKEEMFEYGKRYVDYKNIDFSKFINMKKTTNTSILFDEGDLKQIAISSACLKLYGIFYCEGGKIDKVKHGKDIIIPGLRPPDNQHKELFRYFTGNCVKQKTTDKIFQLMKARTFRSYLMDRYLWDLCKIKTSETPDSYIMTIFNYLMTQLFSTLNPDVNPVPYLNKIVDGSIGWLMKAAHDNKIIYGEAFSGTEDIYGGSHNQHSLFVYTCNDVLAKSTSIGMNILNDGCSQFEMELIEDRIDKIDMIYPYMRLLNLPIINNVLEISYKHLLTIPPKHAILTSVFMYHLAHNTEFHKDFPYLTEYMICCPKFKDHSLTKRAKLSDNQSKILDKSGNTTLSSTKSSYRIRELSYILNNNHLLFGFDCKYLRYSVISSVCGVISASKKNLISVINGRPLQRMKGTQIEDEVANFFNKLYSGNLEPYFKEMRDLADLEYF